ncbi:MAG: dipeptide epimerase [Beijerinckiaceae bacterium]|nr:dipeptide epimerase [Beijerinckiaceae bacterium]
MTGPAANAFGALDLDVAIERFPIAGAFTISRGSRTEAVVVTATVRDGVHVGRGECVPYARYGETVEGVAADLSRQMDRLRQGGDQETLTAGLKAGAARNALDCALWDLAAKRAGLRVWDLAGTGEPQPLITCYTLSLGDPASMEAAARAASMRPLLKVKLGGEGDEARIAAVRRGAPESRIVVDANEAWTEASFDAHVAACVAAGVALIEQPLPAAADAALAHLTSPIPICADESFHGLDSLAAIMERYDAINIKLDKTGGLTAALAVAAAARAHEMPVMVGCMLGTSLAMAPAMLIAAGAAFVDLDGPLLLAKDREPGLRFEGSTVHSYGPELWG